MVSVEFREGITETLDILAHIDKSYTDKIPEKFKMFLKENKSANYIPDFDYTKRLNEMNLKERTKDILAILYMNYWCNEKEKNEYSILLNKNQRKMQKELTEQYNPDNLFKKLNKVESIKNDGNTVKANNALIKYEESIFKKIINMFKGIFNK